MTQRKQIEAWLAQAEKRPSTDKLEGYKAALNQVLGLIAKAPTEPQKRFKAPTVEEVREYMVEKGLRESDAGFSARAFVDFYESKGWKVGKSKMVSWHGAAGGWLSRNAAEHKKVNGYIHRDTTKPPSKELYERQTGRDYDTGELL